jgi:hypothetical protein
MPCRHWSRSIVMGVPLFGRCSSLVSSFRHNIFFLHRAARHLGPIHHFGSQWPSAFSLLV